MCGKRARQYRQRVEELRRITDGMGNGEARDTLLKCVEDYEKFAQREETKPAT